MKKNNSLFSWFNIFKKKNSSKKQLKENTQLYNNENNIKNNSFFSKIKQKIENTKNHFSFKIHQFFFKNKIDDNFFKKLEEKLLIFDFGVHTSKEIVNYLFKKYKNNQFKDEKDVYYELKNYLFSIINFDNINQKQFLKNIYKKPYIILLIGVNGVGKTTIAAKLANFYKKLGKSVVLSASDTFRFAAIEQIKLWGNKISIPVFTKKYGTDPSSVIFDSIEFSILNNSDVLIIDTAGRLHNKINLIKELQKNIRVINKKVCSNPNEILLVLDACNGQNSIIQTKLFSEKINKITGIVLTKLDGTAKGGIIFSIVRNFSIPIQYIGNGEKIQDFYEFNAKSFIKNMFS